jgi:hypothetical protein
MNDRCSKCGMDGHTEESDSCLIHSSRKRHQYIIEELQTLPRNEAVILLSREINRISFEMIMYSDSYRITRDAHRQSIDEYVNFVFEQHLGNMTEEIARERERLNDIRKMRERYAEYNAKAFDNVIQMHEELLEMTEEYSNEELEMANLANGFIEGHVRTAKDYMKRFHIEFDEEISEDDNTKFDCPLCYENLFVTNGISRKECGHKHCIGCFSRYMTSIKDGSFTPTCTICRQEIQNVVSANPFIVDEFAHFIQEL